jgi:hypothetical protein
MKYVDDAAPVTDIDRDIASFQGAGQVSSNTGTDPQSLMEKYKIQQAAEAARQKEELKQLAQTLKKDFEKEMPTVASQMIMHDSKKPASQLVDPIYPRPDSYLDRSGVPKTTMVESDIVDSPTSEGVSGLTTRQKIEAIEKELKIDNQVSSGHKPGSMFIDEFGEETFFIKNISTGHVTLEDIDLPKISRGEVIDLLKYTDIDTLKRSPELRSCLSGAKGRQLLKRLTPEQYLVEIERILNSQKKIDQYRVYAKLKAATGESTKDEAKIRPVVLSKIEKYSLGQGEHPEKGITPIELMEWISIEDLSVNELDYILSAIDDAEVRMFVQQKKRDIL